jgi:hypothetical protein
VRRLARVLGTVAPLALPLLLAPPIAAQAADGALVYEREVYRYAGAYRPDPFRSLLRQGDLGVRIEDLSLRGVVHHPDPEFSVAVLAQRGTDRRIQARVGERVGTLRLMAILPDRVEVVVEELGVLRRVTLFIENPAGEESR